MPLFVYGSWGVSLAEKGASPGRYQGGLQLPKKVSTPSGRAQERALFRAAAAAYLEKKDGSAMDAVVYHTRLYVVKDSSHQRY